MICRPLFACYCVVLALILNISLNTTAAGTEISPASWLDTYHGVLESTPFKVAGFESPHLGLDNQPLTAPAYYSGGPLLSALVVQYGASNDWTATFDQPIQNLMLYAADWRGDYNLEPDPPSHYTFSRPFTILSGFAGASVSGNTLTLSDAPSFYSGILLFAGPTATLQVNSDGLNQSGQWLTFAVTVPEPSTLGLCGMGVFGAGLLVLRRQIRQVL